MGSLSFAHKLTAGGLVGVAAAGWALAFALYGDIAERDADLVRADKLLEKQEVALARAKTAAAGGRADNAEPAGPERNKARIAELEARTDTLLLIIADLEEANQRLRDESVALASQAEKLPPVSEDPVEAFRTITRANLRSGPSTDTDVLVTLPADAKLRVFEAAAGGEWYKVGRIGYVHSDLVQKLQDAPQ